MLVSVVMPAFAAEATIGRAVASLLAQTHGDWEAVIVADDGQDYAAILAGAGITDSRLRFVSTGKVRSGCHNARNVGLAAAAGEIIATLDSDDLYEPQRLALLAPLAAAHGAAVDNLATVSEATGGRLYTAFPETAAEPSLSADGLLQLDSPLFPVVRREFAMPRLPGVEYAEDVIANLRLIECLGSLPLLPRPLYQYRVMAGSLCHDENSGAAFEAAYSAYLARLGDGDAFGLSRTRPAALRGFARKRAVNRSFMREQKRQPGMTFPDFIVHHRGEASGPSAPEAERRGR